MDLMTLAGVRMMERQHPNEESFLIWQEAALATGVDGVDEDSEVVSFLDRRSLYLRERLV